jgi:hypothetical protein
MRRFQESLARHSRVIDIVLGWVVGILFLVNGVTQIV